MNAFFEDPVNYPIIFRKNIVKAHLANRDVFTVYFAVNPPNGFDSILCDMGGTIFTDRDPFSEIDTKRFFHSSSHTIKLNASDKDLNKSSFFLDINTVGGMTRLNENAVVHISQFSCPNDIEHVFELGESTYSFDPISLKDLESSESSESSVEAYYPSAVLELSFVSNIKNSSYLWSDKTVEDRVGSKVLLKPKDAFGVLDIIATIKIHWYEDEDRTIEVDSPINFDKNIKFGIRFYILGQNVFRTNGRLVSRNEALFYNVLPTKTLESLEQEKMSVTYFSKKYVDEEKSLSILSEKNIVVLEGGVFVKDGKEKNVYILKGG